MAAPYGQAKIASFYPVLLAKH